MKKHISITLLSVFFISYSYAQTQTYSKLYDFFKNISVVKTSEHGKNYFDNNSFDTALICYSVIFHNYKPNISRINDSLYADACNRLGIIYCNYYNYEKSTTFLIKGLEICEKYGFNNFEIKIYNNLGNNYLAFSDYENANKYYNRSYNSAIRLADFSTAAYASSNLIGINCQLLNFDKAKFYLKMAKKFELKNNPTLKHCNLMSEGMMYMNIKLYDSALYFLKKSLTVEDIDHKQTCLSLSNIAKTFENMTLYDSALYYFTKSAYIAEKNGVLDMLSKNYQGLSNIYKNNGDTKKWKYFKTKYIEIRDSLFNIREYGKVKEMPFLYEIEKNSKQISMLNEEQIIKDNRIKTQNIILSIVITALLIILALLFIVYIQKRKLSQTYKNLFNKNIEIMESQKYNNGLLRLKYNSDDSDNVKYKNSYLTDEQKNDLINEISLVMENESIFCNPDFSLETLAKMVSSKSKYVSQVINEAYGKNFNSFVNHHRIIKAQEFLTDKTYNNYTIEAIAFQVGFRSRTTFNPVFKEYTGMTPSHYQKMVKKETK